MELDTLLTDLGQFGRYQVMNLALLMFPIVFTAFFSISYVFTSRDLPYRCLIPECEGDADNYNQTWLKFSTPMENNEILNQCIRYKSAILTSDSTCGPHSFQNETETCDRFVYKTSETITTIETDFNLHCDENKWKRTLVGTVNNAGQFIGLPLAGLISDRMGRKNMIIASLLLSTIMGLARSFSSTYISFLIFEFLDAFGATGIYSGGFILGVELVAPQKRVLTSVIICCFYPLGEIIMGAVMWYFESWRISLRVLYAPGILFIFYVWLIPDSVRWLIAKGKYAEATKILERMAAINKTSIPLTQEKLIAMYTNKSEEEVMVGRDNGEGTTLEESIFHSKRLMLRLVVCSFCWMTDTFVFYGLSINSVAVSGNVYLNFMLVSLVEVPAYFSTLFIMDQLGRRGSLFLSFAISGFSCFAFYYISQDMTTLRLFLFLIGKMAITAAFSITYVFTAELFPTNGRHLMLGTCSTVGRIGSMAAPQTRLLVRYMDPILLFGAMSLIAGLLALLFPETLNTRLPDTVWEAENIGKTAYRRALETDKSETQVLEIPIKKTSQDP